MSYRAVFFDLFDTLVLFHRDRLPEISVNGRTMRTTAGRLHAVFQDYAPDIELSAFVDALFWSWQEAERIRAEAHQEVAAPERFDMLLGRLGFPPGRLPADARERLLATHMHELSKAVECPRHHAPLLSELPIIGMLFRSVRYQREETELVVLVTPSLVEPMNPGEVPGIPGEYWRHPNPAEFYLMGDFGSPDRTPRNPVDALPARFRGDGHRRPRRFPPAPSRTASQAAVVS